VWGCEVFFYCCFSFYHSYFLYIIFPFMHLAIWNTYFIIFIVQFHHQITEDLKKPKSPPNCFSCLFIMVYFLEYKNLGLWAHFQWDFLCRKHVQLNPQAGLTFILKGPISMLIILLYEDFHSQIDSIN
jgi:hypothetical protein